MTRCYEYYCMFKTLPENCLKSPSMQRYIRDYIRFMEQKGVKFDGTPADKELFLYIQDTFGSEGAVTREYRKKPCTIVQKEAVFCPFCGSPIPAMVALQIDSALYEFPEESQKIVKYIHTKQK